jgi:hypothetical protein
MAFYSATMLSMALELADADPAYEDVASKFFENFVGIVDAMNRFGGNGLWDDQDGFYYDQLSLDGQSILLRTRSMVGILPIIAVEVLEDHVNSNWRGPIWFPLNYLVVEALERYHHYCGDSLKVECPTGSGNSMNLEQVSAELATRLSSLFLPDEDGHRPCHGRDPRYQSDPHFKDLVLFHEYFHGETGRGVGASHQTGWTALVARCLESLANGRVEQKEEAA